MIYIIGEKKPITTHCIKCYSCYSETEESKDIYYKGLCPKCQFREKHSLLGNYKKRYSPATFRQLESEDPHTANNRRNRTRSQKKKLAKGVVNLKIEEKY